MPVKIEAKEQPLSKIFSPDYVFSIPLYQRPYAWKTEHAGELLSDVVSFLGADDSDVANLNPYFMGSIVLVKGDHPEADVVDGQQRLTTLTILLAALRNLVPDNYAKSLAGYLYQEGDPILGTSNRYRLKLGKRDADFFRQYVQDANGIDQLLQLNAAQLTDSQKNIQDNARYFLEHENGLKALAQSQQIRLLQYLMKQCFLVVVTTPDIDSAYRIFSVMNSRGLDLKLPDILKAEVIGAIPEDKQEVYAHIWESEEEDLGRDAFQELFAHIRMIKRKAKLRETALREYHTHIRPEQAPMKFIDEIVKPYSDAFEIIRNTAYQSTQRADEVNALFKWLNQIDNFDWMPPALVYFSKNLNQPDRLVRFFTLLERLAAGLMIVRADINDRLNRYGHVLTALENGEDMLSDTSPLQLTRDECKRITDVLDGDVYLIRRTRQYILLRLDSTLAQGEASYDYPIISVEHVLPQNPASDSVWVKWFPDKAVREGVVHRLGNLALLSRRKNAQAQNYEFDKKKKLYFAIGKGVSPFALTTQVLLQTEWTHEVVAQRQTTLLNQLKKVWRL